VVKPPARARLAVAPIHDMRKKRHGINMPGADSHSQTLSPAGSGFDTVRAGSVGSIWTAARAYFASDARRAIQTVLGLIWLLDGALQFQTFMYSKGFVQVITGTAAGQPHWLASSINWAAHTFQSNITVFNTLSALTQVIIGLGLLYRPAVKGALSLSFAWALVVWWSSEAFGFLFSDTASPLTGAPGAVLLYAIIGLLAWPTQRPGGLLGVRGARITWAALWLVTAWLWLLAPNSTANATSSAISNAPSGTGWLSSIEHSVASAAAGHGLPIAIVLAAVSAAIGVTVAVNWHPRPFLALGVILNLAYWVIGQGLGGILTGSGTDPNAGPVFILLAFGLYSLVRVEDRAARARVTESPPSAVLAAAPATSRLM
jgi:hypothetical protein